MPHCPTEDLHLHSSSPLSRGTYLVGTQTPCWEPHTDRPHTQRTHTHILPTEQIKYTQLEFCLHTHTCQSSSFPFSANQTAATECVCVSFPLIKTVCDYIKLFPFHYYTCVCVWVGTFVVCIYKRGCVKERTCRRCSVQLIREVNLPLLVLSSTAVTPPEWFKYCCLSKEQLICFLENVVNIIISLCIYRLHWHFSKR